MVVCAEKANFDNLLTINYLYLAYIYSYTFFWINEIKTGKNHSERFACLSLLQECEAGEVCCKIYYPSQSTQNSRPFASQSQVRCRSGNQKCVAAYQCVNGELTTEGLKFAARLAPVSTHRIFFLMLIIIFNFALYCADYCVCERTIMTIDLNRLRGVKLYYFIFVSFFGARGIT